MKHLWIIATKNSGKLKEFKDLLDTNKHEFKSLKDIGFDQEIEETANTFKENASLKAKAVAQYIKHKGIQATVIADDSGLEVESLGGAPGVFSARYAGDMATDKENYELLLSRIKGAPNKRARFVCVLAVQQSSGEIHYFEGSVQGHIHDAPLGEQGFGYDPVFIPETQTKTFAQMDLKEKQKWSHRAQAMQEFLRWTKHSNLE
ncbi:MAG: RdgB/HAM1 family non-canonical purine NTP pyrophosphatase [Fibrobacter sp.]|jgi:XTP/dITP diphosphohydrolase|nr:RdgB/HAM1 family non-canonical purine NTP pyrophosphatase [Fibrobacter sp.]